MTRWDSDFSLVSRKFCSFLYHFLQNLFVRWFMFYASVFMIKLWVSRFFAKHWVLYCCGCLLEYRVWVGIEFHPQPFLFKPVNCFKCINFVFISIWLYVTWQTLFCHWLLWMSSTGTESVSLQPQCSQQCLGLCQFSNLHMHVEIMKSVKIGEAKIDLLSDSCHIM